MIDVYIMLAAYWLIPMAVAAFVLDVFISHIFGGFGRKLVVTFGAFAVVQLIKTYYYSQTWWWVETHMWIAAVLLFVGWIVVEAGFSRNG